VIKLMLADDSVTIRRVVELTFSGQDVQVISVSDGEQAIARLPDERPDIVLADIGMPKRSGYEVAEFVKGHPDLAHIPVVLLAGAFEPVDEQRAKDVGCDGVLVKPFDPPQVIARVRELVNGKAAGRAQPTVAPAPAPAEPPAGPTAAEPQPQPDVEPEIQQVQAQVAGEASLDDYFDQLDAAFATLGTTSSTPGSQDPFGDREVPTVDDLLADSTLRAPSGAAADFGRVTLPTLEPPDVNPTLAAAPHTPSGLGVHAGPAALTGNPIAEVFRALLAAEQGDAHAALRFGPTSPQPVVTDELVEEVTRRVLERLAPDAARQLVADIVSEVAERLVREEIARVRNQQ